MMGKFNFALLFLAAIYVLQVCACTARMLIPYKTLVIGPYRVDAIYGSDSHQVLMPLWGLIVFSGDGNRIRIFKSGVMMREVSIDLFGDFNFDAVRIFNGHLWIPDPGGPGFWVGDRVPNQSVNGSPWAGRSNSPRKWHAATPCSLAGLAPPRLGDTPLALGRLSNCPRRAQCMLTPNRPWPPLPLC